MKDVGALLYPLTIVVTLVAVTSALFDVVQTRRSGQSVSAALSITYASLLFVAGVCVVYLWDKRMARVANCVYALGWGACFALSVV